MLRSLKDRLREIAETPLLLKLLCEVYADPDLQFFEKVGDLKSKGELFRAVDRKYNTWKNGEGVRTSAKFWQWNGELLRRLAFDMLQADGSPTGKWLQCDRAQAERLLEQFLQGRVTAPGEQAKDWLQDLLDHHLLQVAANPNQIEFRHQLFQEYYAAEYLLLQLSTLSDAKLKRDYLNLLKWTEPLAMMAALIPDETQAVQVVKLALEVDWKLGARLAGEVKPKFQEQTVGLVNKLIDEKRLPEWLKVELLGETRSEVSISYLTKIICNEEDRDLVLQSAFALRRIGSKSAVPMLLEALTHNSQLTVCAALFSLGGIGDDKAIPKLQQTLSRHEDDGIRAQAADALGELGNQAVAPDLLEALKDESERVRTKAAEALGDLACDSAISALVKIAVEESSISLRWVAGRALSQINGDKAANELIKSLKDPNRETRQNAAEALGKVGSEKAILPLVASFEDGHIRWKAARTIKELNAQQAIPELIKALKHDHPCVAECAAWTLGELGNYRATERLISVLFNWYPGLTAKAAEALGKLGDQTAVPELRKLLQANPSKEIRGKLVIALGTLGDGQVLPELLRILEDPNVAFTLGIGPYDWWKPLKALEAIGGKTVVSGLIQALKSTYTNVRWESAKALGHLADDDAIDGLLTTLLDKNSTVRMMSAEALGKFESRLVLLKLVEFLKPNNNPSIQNPDIREAAIRVFGYLVNQSSVEVLTEFLTDPEFVVRFSAIEALIKLSNSPMQTQVSQVLSSDWKIKLLNDHFSSSIAAIQANCQFYNYEIFGSDPVPEDRGHLFDSFSTVYIESIKELTLMSNKQPIINQQGTFGIGYAAEGSNSKVIQNVRNTQQASPETALNAVVEIIRALEQKYSFVQDEQQALSIIDAEFKEIKAKQLPQWQDLMNVKRLWNGGKKAAVKVGEHFTDQNPWGKGLMAFLEGVSEDVK